MCVGGEGVIQFSGFIGMIAVTVQTKHGHNEEKSSNNKYIKQKHPSSILLSHHGHG